VINSATDCSLNSNGSHNIGLTLFEQPSESSRWNKNVSSNSNEWSVVLQAVNSDTRFTELRNGIDKTMYDAGRLLLLAARTVAQTAHAAFNDGTDLRHRLKRFEERMQAQSVALEGMQAQIAGLEDRLGIATQIEGMFVLLAARVSQSSVGGNR
jgi:hypothetical protein